MLFPTLKNEIPEYLFDLMNEYELEGSIDSYCCLLIADRIFGETGKSEEEVDDVPQEGRDLTLYNGRISTFAVWCVTARTG